MDLLFGGLWGEKNVLPLGGNHCHYTLRGTSCPLAIVICHYTAQRRQALSNIFYSS